MKFRSSRHRVLVVDLDSQHCATTWFSFQDGDRGILDVFLGTANLSDIVRKTEVPGVDLIPSSSWMMGAEKALAREVGAETILRRQIQLISEDRTVLYVGADSSMAIRLSADGQVVDSVKNERCAVSSGALLDIVSRMLEIPVEDLGPMSLQATTPQTVSSRCVVFAEGEILSFIHQDPPVAVPDVLAGVHQCIADGLWGMVQKVGVPSELLLCGGVARNTGIVRAIEARLGRPALVPQQPQYVRALGAAVFARKLQQEGGEPC